MKKIASLFILCSLLISHEAFGGEPAKVKPADDKAKLYFELGSAYTKAKLYKNAIDAYLASLEADPKNAEAHYNLGLLYQRYQGDTNKAVFHFQKYLKSNPPPDRKKEVQYFLSMLRSGREWVTANY